MDTQSWKWKEEEEKDGTLEWLKKEGREDKMIMGVKMSGMGPSSLLPTHHHYLSLFIIKFLFPNCHIKNPFYSFFLSL